MAKAKHINDTVSDLPEGFKMTELGPLPEEWEVVRLGEVAKFINGFAFGPEHWAETGRPIIRIQNLTGLSQKFNYFNGGINKKYIVIKGDLLVSWSASIDVFMWNGDEAWLNQHIFKVTDYSTKVSKDFLFFALKHRINQIKDKTHGSTMKHITRKEFLAIPIPLPPLSEQKAIAYVLQTVQRAKEATEKVIQATQELKKSLMRHLFTYGPVPVDEVDKVQLKETEIGLVPEHWEVVRLGELANIRYGKAKPKTSGSIPVIGSGGIYAWTDQALVDFPTLIIGRKGTAGQVWLVRGSCWPSDTTFYLEWHIPDCRAIADFLYCVFLLNPLSGEHAKTTLPSLQRHDLENYLIPLPPIHEQQEIAHILQAVDQKIEAEKAKKQALETLFQSLLHNLMTGKLCVKDIILPKTKEMI